MALIFWDCPRVAADFMNEEHETFVDLMNEAEDALTLGRFNLQHFRRLVQHCQEHFAHEEREMVRTGFPAYGCHKQEHDRVMTAMLELLSLYEDTENIAPLLEFVQDALPEWFVRHIGSMDKVTGEYLARHKTSAA